MTLADTIQYNGHPARVVMLHAGRCRLRLASGHMTDWLEKEEIR